MNLNTDNLILIFKYLDYKSLFNLILINKFFFKIINKYYRLIYIDILKKFNIKYITDLTFEHATSLKIFYEELKIYDIIINNYDDKVFVKRFYNVLNEALVIAHYKHIASVLIIKNNERLINHKLLKYLLEGDLIVYLDNDNKIRNIEIYINFNNYLFFDKLEIGYKTLFEWKYNPTYWCRIQNRFIPVFLKCKNIKNIEYDVTDYFVGHGTDIHELILDNWQILFSSMDLIEKAKINNKTLKFFFKLDYDLSGELNLIKNILFIDINDFDDMDWALCFYMSNNERLEL